MVPAPFDGARPSARTPPTPGRSSSSRAPASALAFAPGQFTMLVRRRRRRGADLDQRRPGPARARSCTRCARSGWPPQAICAAEPGRRARRARPVRPALAGRASSRARDVVIAAGGIGLAPLRPAILRAARAPRALRAAGAALRRARARPAAVRRRARRSGPSAGLEVRSPSTAPGRSGSATSASSPRLVAPRRARRRATPSRCSCGPEVMMRFTVAALARRRASARDRIYVVDGAQHAVRHRPLRPLPARPDARLPRRAGLPLVASSSAGSRSGSCDGRPRKPTLAVWKFASCDGCQLSLLDCEDELLALADRARDRLLPRGHAARPSRARTTSRSSRARSRPPHDAERIQRGPAPARGR